MTPSRFLFYSILYSLSLSLSTFNIWHAQMSLAFYTNNDSVLITGHGPGLVEGQNPLHLSLSQTPQEQRKIPKRKKLTGSLSTYLDKRWSTLQRCQWSFFLASWLFGLLVNMPQLAIIQISLLIFSSKVMRMGCG